MTTILPHGLYLTVRRDAPDDKFPGGVIINPHSGQTDQPRMGEVVGVGCGGYGSHGAFEDIPFKPGERIMYAYEYGGREIRSDDENLDMIPVGAILASVE